MRYTQHHTGVLKLAVIATLLAVRACALTDWWLMGYQAWHCQTVSPRQTWYAYNLVDADCHNFGADGNCTFHRNTRGMVETKPCNVSGRTPHYVQGVTFAGDRNGSMEQGCSFYPKRSCRGKYYFMDAALSMNGCYEFYDRIASFKCV